MTLHEINDVFYGNRPYRPDAQTFINAVYLEKITDKVVVVSVVARRHTKAVYRETERLGRRIEGVTGLRAHCRIVADYTQQLAAVQEKYLPKNATLIKAF